MLTDVLFGMAVENLRLREEVQDLQREMEADEVNALRADLDAMRLQALQTADQLRQLQSTPVVSPSMQALLIPHVPRWHLSADMVKTHGRSIKSSLLAAASGPSRLFTAKRPANEHSVMCCLQVRNAEAAAAKAAYESSSIIEEAMAQAAAIVKQAEQDAQAKSKAQVHLHPHYLTCHRILRQAERSLAYRKHPINLI